MTGVLAASTAMRRLQSDLTDLDWGNEPMALRSAASLLGDRNALMQAVSEELEAWRVRGLEERSLICRETPTHWKWFIGGSTELALLWLHEYKPFGDRREGYADSIHDHRYSFVSAVIRGGYEHRYYSKVDGWPTLTRKVRVAAGDVYVMDADEIHNVADLVDGTLTMIVQAPKRRSYSTEYRPDAPNGRRRHYDFDARAALAPIRVGP